MEYRVICEDNLLFLMNEGYHIDGIIDTETEKVYNTSKLQTLPKLKTNENRS